MGEWAPRGVDREATAYHEAGHAVAFILLRLRFSYVTTRGSRNSKGHVRRSHGTAVTVHKRRAREAVAAFAGPAAELHWRGGGAVLGDLLAGAASDMGAVGRLCTPFDEATVQALCEEAYRLVITHWPAISAVAYALIDAGPRKIGERKVRTLVTEALAAELRKEADDE